MSARLLLGLFAPLLILVQASHSLAQMLPDKEKAAKELLAKNGIEVEGNYLVTRYLDYKNGGGVISAQQVYNGLTVFDSELVFHFVDGGELVRAQDGLPNLMGAMQTLDGLVVNRDLYISAQEAARHFSDGTKQVIVPSIDGEGPGSTVSGPKCAQDPEAVEAELGIYQQKVVWRLGCKQRRNPVMYIDAIDGATLFFDSGIRS